MKHIIIFGDSYGDPKNKPDLKFKETRTWYERLESNYNVINHSVEGSGPHYSFKKYYDFISNKKRLSDYTCIFLLSGQDRINFFSRKPHCGTHIVWNKSNQKSYLLEEADKQFYNNFRSEIDFFYLTMQDEIDWFNLKNLSFLYVNSILLGLKTIVFLTSTSYENVNSVNNVFLNIFINYSKLNNSNFFTYPNVLSDISEMEFTDIEQIRNEPTRIKYAFSDHRRNHFSQENHDVFYKNLEKIIANDYTLSAFKKHLNPCSYYGEVSPDEHIEENKFIYD